MLYSDKEKLKFEASSCLPNTYLPWRNPARAVKVWVKIDINMHAIYGTRNNYIQKYGYTNSKSSCSLHKKKNLTRYCF